MTYTVDELFRVRGEVTIEPWGKKLYLRTVSITAHNERNERALQASLEMRRALESGDCYESEHYIKPLETAPRETLIAQAVLLQTGLLRRRAQLERFAKNRPERPDTGEIADLLDWQEQLKQIDQEVEEERRKWAEEQLEAYKTEVGELDDAALSQRVRDLRIGNLCELAFTQAWDQVTLYYATFRDEECKEAFFKSPEETQDIAPGVYAQLWSGYINLDRFSLEGEALKNSP